MLDIIIPFYNNTPVLLRCLRALESATPNRHRLLLVDDGSSQEHRRALDQYLMNLDRSLDVVTHDQNKGFKEAINTAMRHTRAEYVLLLNDDTVPTPDFDEKLLETVRMDARIKAAGPVSNHPTDLFQYREELRGITVGQYVHPAEVERMFRAHSQSKKIAPAPYLTGMCLLMDRSVFEHAGFMDSSYEHGYFEDLALCCQIREMGYHLAIREDCFVYHKGHETYKHKSSEEKHRIIMRNFSIFESHWGHMPEHPVLLQKMEYAGREHPI